MQFACAIINEQTRGHSEHGETTTGSTRFRCSVSGMRTAETRVPIAASTARVYSSHACGVGVARDDGDVARPRARAWRWSQPMRVPLRSQDRRVPLPSSQQKLRLRLRARKLPQARRRPARAETPPMSVTTTTTVRICNRSSRERVLHVEPWGEQYLLVPGAAAELVFTADQPGIVAIEEADDHSTVFGWSGSVVDVVIRLAS